MLLADGTVLDIATTAYRYSPATDAWSTAGTMSVAREEQAAVRLADGRVLVTGGRTGGVERASTELYDPATNAWTPGEPMLVARSRHAAVLLPSGLVLIAGGTDPNQPATAELFDPTKGITCTTAADCSANRANCVGGRCCDAPCNGGCAACDLPGREGICSPRDAGDPGAPSCSPYLCDGTDGGCPSGCAADSSCAQTHFCWSGACQPNGTGTNGVACRADAQCASGHCIDGVCCDSACAGPCLACNLPPTVGTCSPSAATTDDPQCNGYVCSIPDAGCLTACAVTSHCTATRRCVDAGCVDKLPLGGACVDDPDCQSGHCASGTCCSSACNGGCGTCVDPPYDCQALPPGTPSLGCGRYLCAGQRICPPYCGWAGCSPGYSCTTWGRCVPNGTGAPGMDCTHPFDCLKGWCSDGVCCDVPCGGFGCEACNVDAGAAVNGVCGPVPAGRVCRDFVDGGCDAIDRCDGVHLLCPNDAFLPVGTICRPPAGSCDDAERCSGKSAFCPAVDLLTPAETVCRVPAGTCDVTEFCTGTSVDCPGDVLVDAGHPCRPGSNVCDPDEVCSGKSGECPSDVRLPDGTGCGLSVICVAGACVADPMPPADAGSWTARPTGCGCTAGEGLGLTWAALTFALRRRQRR